MIGWIILGLLVLMITLLCFTRIRLDLNLGQINTVTLKIGPFRIPLVPGAEEEPEQEETPTEETPQQERAPQGSFRKLFSWEDWQDARQSLGPPMKRALERGRKGIRIDPLRLSVTVPGGRDPAEGAQIYGYAHMAVWTGMPILEECLVIPDPYIHIGLDFDAMNWKAEGALSISARIGTLIRIGAGTAIPGLRWLLRVRKRKQAERVKEGSR